MEWAVVAQAGVQHTSAPAFLQLPAAAVSPKYHLPRVRLQEAPAPATAAAAARLATVLVSSMSLMSAARSVRHNAA